MTDAITGLKRRIPDGAQRFAAMDAALREELAEVMAAGSAAVPQILFSDIAAGTVPPQLPGLVRRRGCVVVRGVFPRRQAEGWNAELMEYLGRIDAAGAMRARRPARWGAATPQMFSVYWSPPQLAARSAAEMAACRAWLNRLWHYAGWFDPDEDCHYADRVRVRLPGDTSLRLGPHIDGGTQGRWLGTGARPYSTLLAGDPAAFDPFDAAHRTDPPEPDDANACAMFRSFQGWTALTAQGPGDGTLQVVPVARAIGWVLLRPFAPDVPAASLCGAEAAGTLWIAPEWHAPLLAALVPIPFVEPGDTVWWHPDLIHAVEMTHGGTHPSSVMYIPAAPGCSRNRECSKWQLAAFQDGRSPADFPRDDLEVGVSGQGAQAGGTARDVVDREFS